MADFIRNDDSVIPELREIWKRGRPCSVSQMLTKQLASTHLLFHYSLAELLSESANVFPRHFNIRCCVIHHCAATERKSTLLTTHTFAVTEGLS